jgi:hypothetical protein
MKNGQHKRLSPSLPVSGSLWTFIVEKENDLAWLALHELNPGASIVIAAASYAIAVPCDKGA